MQGWRRDVRVEERCEGGGSETRVCVCSLVTSRRGRGGRGGVLNPSFSGLHDAVMKRSPAPSILQADSDLMMGKLRTDASHATGSVCMCVCVWVCVCVCVCVEINSLSAVSFFSRE